MKHARSARVLGAARCCAAAGGARRRLRDGPVADDPFEPMNRAMYAGQRRRRHGTSCKPVAQAYVDYRAAARSARACRNFFNNIDDLFSAINGLLQGKLDKAGNDFGRVMLNTGFGLGGLIDIASMSASSAATRTSGRRSATGASRRGRTCSFRCSGRRRCATARARPARLRRPDRLHPDVAAAQRHLRHRLRSTCARRRSTRVDSSTRRRSTATRSSATRTCSGATTWSTTASRRQKRRS